MVNQHRVWNCSTVGCLTSLLFGCRIFKHIMSSTAKHVSQFHPANVDLQIFCFSGPQISTMHHTLGAYASTAQKHPTQACTTPCPALFPWFGSCLCYKHLIAQVICPGCLCCHHSAGAFAPPSWHGHSSGRSNRGWRCTTGTATPQLT